MISLCSIKRRDGELCRQEAIVIVAYFQDGRDGRHSCATHLARTVEEVFTRDAVPAWGELRITPLETLRKRLR
jgi:hypothetical protein